MDKIKEQITDFLQSHDTHAGAAVLIGILILFVVIKAQKVFLKLILVLVALGLFAGAWWWHQHK